MERVVGRVVGGHRLERLLGRGGMGEVWLATHLETGATRALKLAQPGADADLRARFEREGEAQARVSGHPNVVRVHAAGHEPDGTAWLSMDLLEGGDLSERLEDGPLEPREAARIAAALARGVAHLHAHGVLHRDVKPQNVLFDGEDRPRLGDFGLARLSDACGLTRSGVVLGTPSYAAPEQLEGSTGAAAPLVDVYGLGAVLYHMLAGRPPYTGVNLVSVLRQALVGKPVSVDRVVPGIPRELAALTMRALSRDPAQRPASAADLASELEAFLQGELASGRSRVVPILALLAAIALLLATIAVVTRAPRKAAPEVGPATTAHATTVASSSPAPVATIDALLARIEAAAARSPLELRQRFAIAIEPTAEDERLLAHGNLALLDPALLKRAEAGDPTACLELATVVRVVNDPPLVGRYLFLAARHPTRPTRAFVRLADHLDRHAHEQEALALAVDLAAAAAFAPDAGRAEADCYGRLLVAGRSATNAGTTFERAARCRADLPRLPPAFEPWWGGWLGVALLRTAASDDERRVALQRIELYRTATGELPPAMQIAEAAGRCAVAPERAQEAYLGLLGYLRSGHVEQASDAANHLELLIWDDLVAPHRLGQVRDALRALSGPARKPSVEVAIALLELRIQRGAPLPLDERRAFLGARKPRAPTIQAWLSRPSAPPVATPGAEALLAALEAAMHRSGEDLARDLFAINPRILPEDQQAMDMSRRVLDDQAIAAADAGDPAACLELAQALGMATARGLVGHYLLRAARHPSHPPLALSRLADHLDRAGAPAAWGLSVELAAVAAFDPRAGEEEVERYGRILACGKASLYSGGIYPNIARTRRDLPRLEGRFPGACAHWLGLAMVRRPAGEGELREGVLRVERFIRGSSGPELHPSLEVALATGLCHPALGRAHEGLDALIRVVDLRKDISRDAEINLEWIVYDDFIPADRLEQVEQAFERIPDSANPGKQVALQLVRARKERGAPLSREERVAIIRPHAPHSTSITGWLSGQ